MYLGRDAYAAGLRQRFEARRDIDALAIDVAALANHVTQINACPKDDAALFAQPGICLAHLALEFDSRFDGVESAGEFDKHPVAHHLHDPAVMGANGRFEDAGAPLHKRRQRAGFVGFHEPAVADYIRQ